MIAITRIIRIRLYGELKQKLSGELDWDFGPVGERATTEYVQNWKKMHNKKLADGYFECVAQAAD